MEQVIIGGYSADLLDTANTMYNSLQGGYGWLATDVFARKTVSTDGKIKQLRVKLSGSPGAGKKYTFTVVLGGNPTALTFDIADAATSGADMVHEFNVTGGDTLSLQCDPDGTPTARYATWTCVFEGDTPNESLIMGGAYTQLNPAATEYGQVMGAYTDYSAIETDFRQVVPTSGTIKDFYVTLSSDPGTAPDAYRFTLRKGGASQTLTVTIVANDTTGNDLVNSFAVSPDDTLTMMIEPLNAPSGYPRANWGMTFVADIDGESIILGGSHNNLPDVATEHNLLTSREANTWTVDETTRYQLGQICTLKKLHFLLTGSPGAGNSYQFMVRVAGADSDVTCIVSDLETTGHSSVSAKVDLANDDYVNLRVVPTGTPTIRDSYWGLVCYTGTVESAYTEKIASFAIAADAAWTDYDLFTNQGVPKGAVAEIVCANKNTDFARVAGIRTDGSALNRYIDIHEAEGLGVGTATMFVKCHATTGLIECYSEIQGDVDFYLLGYFSSDVDFTEAFTSLGQPGLAWADKDLTASGVPDNAAVQILMGNENDGADFFAGVRANGSALERGYTLDEAEADGWTPLSMVVQSDSDAVIEWKGGSVTDVTMWLLGWFSSNVGFTEGFTDYSPAVDNIWTEKTVAEAAASSVVAFALVHQDSGAETFCGLREEGSILARMIEEHEAEGGSSTGFQACVQLDPDKKCDVYCEDANEAQFAYTGYFSIEVIFSGSADLAAKLSIAGIFAASENLSAEFGIRHEASMDLVASFDSQVSLNLPGEFVVRQVSSADLLGEFIVRQEDSKDLAASFDGQVSLNLAAEFTIWHEASEGLLGRFNARHDSSAELLGEFVVRYLDLVELIGEFVVKQSGSVELLGEFNVGLFISSEDLFAELTVQHADSADLLGKSVIRTAGSVELLGKLTVGVLFSSVELLGKLEARHPATTELLGSGDIRQPGSTGISAKTEIRRPDSAELLGKFITKRSTTSEVLGKFVVRHVGISVELICQCMIRHSSIADLFVKVNLTHSVTLLGRFVLRHLAAEELAANVQVCHWEELLGKFRVIHWTRLLGQFTVRHSTATDLSVKFQVAHWERLFTKLWIRHPYRLWTNRHYLNGVVELDEENLSDAFLEYVIQGVMDDVRSWLINEDMLVYDSWTDITETPKLIRRATTYGTVASLYSRDVNDPNSRIVLGLRPMRIRAAEIRSAQERAMDYWESRMEKMMNLYLTSGGRRLMIVDTEDEEAVFSMEDIPFYSADPFKIKVR